MGIDVGVPEGASFQLQICLLISPPPCTSRKTFELQTLEVLKALNS